MKIYSFNFKANEDTSYPHPLVTVQKEGAFISLEIDTSAIVNEGEKKYISINSSEYPEGEVLEVLIHKSSRRMPVTVQPKYRHAEYGSVIRSFDYSNNLGVAFIVIPPSGTEDISMLVYLDCEVKAINAEIIKLDPEKSINSQYAELSPYFAQRKLKHEIKADLINSVDIYESVAYLEAQLDLVTRLLLQAISPEYKVENKQALVELLIAADNNSSLPLKGLDKVLEQVGKDKKSFRKKQENYFKKKSNLESKSNVN